MKLWTIGCTGTTAEGFFETLRAGGPRRLVDSRLNNVSQLAGFTRRDDPAYFLRQLLGIDCVHRLDLAPTDELLGGYRAGKLTWPACEAAYLQLLDARRAAEAVPRELLDGAVLLCSEDRPDRCHRRLAAEYLQRAWGDLDVEHLICPAPRPARKR
ncbi:DUF488 domain-containing protein [Tepidiforma sp.]|uniref:DUF488 domain-containing protein n=1 Tax=Tepidiforma sp. TaxID=2682230 RepID=UPI002ADDFDA4|nr:DUF488 domain-containing protein [Tepidiforma sp.]